MNISTKITKLDFKTKLNVNDSHEIKNAIKSFNHIVESLIKSNEDLTNLAIAIDEANIVAKTDRNGTITYVNDKFCEISKYSREELIGQNHRILKSGHHPDSFYTGIWRVIADGSIWRGEIKNKAKDGSYYWVKTVIVPFLDDKGIPKEFLSIRTDITNRKIAEDQLRTAFNKIKEKEKVIKFQLEEMEKIDRQKDEFASMISHELKSPLGPILGYIELLKYQQFSDSPLLQLEAIDEIFENAKRLENIINDVLDAERLNMRQLSFNKVKFDVGEFMTKLTKEFLPLMTKKQIQFKIKTTSQLILESDGARLRQVLDNLIRNAIDFVPEKNGKIEVGVHRQDENVVFSVKDNGIGISKKQQSNLFKKFYQVDTSYTRKHGGTGLGLVISKGMVEGLGGKIWVESESGKGSIFYFSIPKYKQKVSFEDYQEDYVKR